MSPGGGPGRTTVTLPVFGSILLASRDPDRLRTWYRHVLHLDVDASGLILFESDEVAATNPEPARSVLRVDVSDRSWSGPTGTMRDLDGNLVQRRRAPGSSTARIEVVIASSAPPRLAAWYRSAFEVDMLVVPRPDLAPRAVEPQRFVPNVVVDDAGAVEARLIAGGAVWVRELESGRHGRIGTVLDPDGNYVQFIERPRAAGPPGRTEPPPEDRIIRAARADGPTRGGAGSSDPSAEP
jgi:hypothetical protein